MEPYWDSGEAIGGDACDVGAGFSAYGGKGAARERPNLAASRLEGCEAPPELERDGRTGWDLANGRSGVCDRRNKG